MVGSWRLVAAGGWRRLVAGGWWRLVVGGWWRLAVDGSWRLAVGGPLGRSLRAVLSQKKISRPLRTPLGQRAGAGALIRQEGLWSVWGTRAGGSHGVHSSKFPFSSRSPTMGLGMRSSHSSGVSAPRDAAPGSFSSKLMSARSRSSLVPRDRMTCTKPGYHGVRAVRKGKKCSRLLSNQHRLPVKRRWLPPNVGYNRLLSVSPPTVVGYPPNIAPSMIHWLLCRATPLHPVPSLLHPARSCNPSLSNHAPLAVLRPAPAPACPAIPCPYPGLLSLILSGPALPCSALPSPPLPTLPFRDVPHQHPSGPHTHTLSLSLSLVVYHVLQCKQWVYTWTHRHTHTHTT